VFFFFLVWCFALVIFLPEFFLSLVFLTPTFDDRIAILVLHPLSICYVVSF